MNASWIRLSVLIPVAALAGSMPAHARQAAPTPFSSEFLVDSSRAVEPDPMTQQYPALARAGSTYLAVWGGEPRSLAGARLTARAEVVDSAAVRYGLHFTSDAAPGIAGGDTTFLAVCEAVMNALDNDVVGVVIHSSGAPDTAPVMICRAPREQVHPRVAFDGTAFLVVWQDERDSGNADIYGARVTATGVVLDPGGFPISKALGNQTAPTVAFDGANYLVIWQDEREGVQPDIYAARVTPSGAVLDTTGIAVAKGPGSELTPALAFANPCYLAVWVDAHGSQGNVNAARIRPDGILLDSNAIAVEAAPANVYYPAVAYNGADFQILWQDGRSVYTPQLFGARLSMQGSVLDSQSIRISPSGNFEGWPAIVRSDSGCLAVWFDDRTGYDIYGTAIRRDGRSPDSVARLVSLKVRFSEEWYSAVAANGTEYLTVWPDNLSRSLSGLRVSASGQVLDRSPIRFPGEPDPDSASSPAVASDGDAYLAVWGDPNAWEIRAARCSRAGVLLDSSGIVAESSSHRVRHPGLAFGGSDYLAVWAQAAAYGYGVSGARISPTGAVSQPMTIAADTSWAFLYPAVGFGGSCYLVTWLAVTDLPSGNGHVLAARLATDGTLLDSVPLLIRTTSAFWSAPAIASDGSGFLVAWTDYRPGGATDDDIFAARVSSSGVLLDSLCIPVDSAQGAQLNPTVVYDGRDYVVAWEDAQPGWMGIRGARVSPNGTVGPAFGIAHDYRDHALLSPKLARGSGDALFTTFARVTDSIGRHAVGLHRIWGKIGPLEGLSEAGRTQVLDQPGFRVSPNPFRRHTQFDYALAGPAGVVLALHDVSGRQVRLLCAGKQAAGRHSAVWDGRDNLGRRLPAGVYVARLSSGAGPALTLRIVLCP